MSMILRESKMQRPDETSETSMISDEKNKRWSDGCIFYRPTLNVTIVTERLSSTC